MLSKGKFFCSLKQLTLLMLFVLMVGCGKTNGTETVKEEKEIVLAGTREVKRGTKDPYYTNVSFSVWEPLIGISDEGELEPVLATQWELINNDKTWRFTLRQGVTFSDGYAFNADSVIENFERYKKLGLAVSTFFPFNFESNYPGFIDIQKVDDYTVDLNFEKPVPTLPYLVINYGSPMFSPNSFDKETGEFTKACIGTGAFIIKEHVLHEYIVLERNENYYGNKAKSKQLKIVIIPDHETRIAALKAGEVMGIFDSNSIKPLSALELIKSGNFDVSSKLSTNVHFLTVNNLKEPLDNKDIRKAISLVIDREVLAEQIYGGFAKPTNNVLSPFSSFYKEHPIEHDIEKAKEIINTASNGEELEITLLCSDLYKTNAELIASWIEELGIKVNIEMTEYKILYEKIKNQEHYLATSHKGMNNADPEIILEGYLASDGFMNTGHAMSLYSNKEADELIKKLKKTVSAEERVVIYNQLQDIAVSDMPIIPLLGLHNIVVSSNQIKGFEAKFNGATLTEVEWK